MADFDSAVTFNPVECRPADEQANLITHAVGFLLSLAASAILMTLVIGGRGPVPVAACGVYCATLVGLYASSMLSHMFYDPARRRFFRTLDQACIYLLIAGSFTPVAIVLLGHGWWPVLPAAMWGLAIVGVGLVLRLRELPPRAMASYGVLGWLPVISLKAMYDAAPFAMLVWFVAGGVLYTVGTVFLRYDRHVRYFHALWHTFVIAGSACHYVAVLLLVVRM